MQAIIQRFCKEEMGGRVYACMVGSAPSAPEVVHFLRTALTAPILESFGSTETGEDSSACACHLPLYLWQDHAAGICPGLTEPFNGRIFCQSCGHRCWSTSCHHGCLRAWQACALYRPARLQESTRRVYVRADAGGCAC